MFTNDDLSLRYCYKVRKMHRPFSLYYCWYHIVVWWNILVSSFLSFEHFIGQGSDFCSQHNSPIKCFVLCIQTALFPFWQAEVCIYSSLIIICHDVQIFLKNQCKSLRLIYFSFSCDFSYLYHFDTNDWSAVYKHKARKDLKLKAGYDSSVDGGLKWAGVWVCCFSLFLSLLFWEIYDLFSLLEFIRLEMNGEAWSQFLWRWNSSLCCKSHKTSIDQFSCFMSRKDGIFSSVVLLFSCTKRTYCSPIYLINHLEGYNDRYGI
jgi:hypothetical protein